MTVQSDETLPRVFRKLAIEGFLSAPVLEGREYVGFIDMLDLVKKTIGLFWGDTVEQWVNFWDKEERFMSTTVGDVMRMPSTYERDPFPPLRPDFTTFYALEVMARTSAHRMAIVNPETNRVTGILTHSMLISWLRQNLNKFGNLSKKPVSEIQKTLKNRVITIGYKEKAINAFNTMVDKNVSGLAVVDENGVLTGAISVRDLRGVGTSGEFFYRLFHTVRDFKKETRDDFPKQAPKTHYSRKMVPLKGLYVGPTNTLEDVITMMNDGNIHRVFVCTPESIEAKKPIPTHVISQKDVLLQVLGELVEGPSDSQVAAAD